ncbi:MAG: quinolinate synthase NadA, partial [Anaerovoracaceae bacterium]
MNDKIHKIQSLKKEKNAVIMAHYYVEDEVQKIADFVGDSYYLSDMATKVDADMIVICGVSFMGESAKILNPDKKVMLPEAEADCPMAHMATVEKINEIREKYEDVSVVCYVNSTAEIKAVSDVCVTSSNALKIVGSLPNKNIFFVPDKNLAHFIA